MITGYNHYISADGVVVGFHDDALPVLIKTIVYQFHQYSDIILEAV